MALAAANVELNASLKAASVWFSRVPDASVRGELNDWLAHTIRPMFEQRVLQVTEDIMVKWRSLVEEGRKTGHTNSQPDLIIAATVFITVLLSSRGMSWIE